MEPNRAQGKRSHKCKIEDEIEEEEDEDEDEDDDVSGLGFGSSSSEDIMRKKRPAQYSINSSSSTSSCGAVVRRSGSSAGGSTRPPSCQADNCNADLTEAKHYHRRHKICEFHAKASVVSVAGLQQRFCQQCSSMGCQSLMKLKGVVEGAWLVIMRGVGKAHLTFIEKGPIENKTD
ncbi:hypothetical protein CsatB_000925 [Cannabis sativa]